MYKCDLCRQRLMSGDQPLCITACPQKAMQIGRRDEITSEAERLKQKYDGDLYGVNENGGTSTIYVPPVSFKELDKALVDQAKAKGRKLTTVTRLNSPENMLAKQKNWALLSLLSPLFGIAAALGLAGKKSEDRGQDQ